MRILIADDHTLFRDSLRSLLEARDFEVVGEADDGLRAVEMARRLEPDVVLMDITMPEMDGLAATRVLAEKAPACKILMLTASDDDEHVFAALEAGASGYLLKDLRSDALFRTLEEVTRGDNE